jgi:hypothetical protein
MIYSISDVILVKISRKMKMIQVRTYSVKGCQKGLARALWMPAMSRLHHTSSIIAREVLTNE